MKMLPAERTRRMQTSLKKDDFQVATERHDVVDANKQ
jgi:hypothetical protein